jgi:hypothetical protein
VLSEWMAENAFVSWVVREAPWELEDELIAALDLPLNLKGNQRNSFHRVLTQARARCVAQARALPVLASPGIGGEEDGIPRPRRCPLAAVRPTGSGGDECRG